MSDLEQLMSVIGYQFNDIDKLKRALTHRSASSAHYERFEFLGDAFLGAIIAEALFKKYPGVPEGKLSRMRSVLVNGESLAKLAKKIDLSSFVILGQGERIAGGEDRTGLLSDVLESLIGAIYDDSNFATMRDVVLGWFKDDLDVITPDESIKDPKTLLQEWAQARHYALPTYETLYVHGEAHNQIFEVSCSLAEIDVTTTGKDVSRKKAEQIAARELLIKIANIKK